MDYHYLAPRISKMLAPKASRDARGILLPKLEEVLESDTIVPMRSTGMVGMIKNCWHGVEGPLGIVRFVRCSAKALADLLKEEIAKGLEVAYCNLLGKGGPFEWLAAKGSTSWNGCTSC
ncbi:LOW QUALITY PROTEIN: hypothetical protein CVT26_008271 [Gymnopilus dilepis]|uniref:Uncharacterized protein n=1 Tax=Gymnopilus dilepis TaxID=231916 RepID=A0A409WPE1_9AGAR|nr:LOW QUALITY PROTEIN: hypothetical protein CVT26_008271 [Gymnopilus dilepis]